MRSVRRWRERSSVYFAVFAYLIAIVIANGLITKYGPTLLPVTAFMVIPFDLTTRNFLHEEWKDDRLKSKMTALIVCGSVISFGCGVSSPQVAIASMVAFLISGLGDSLTYHALVNHPYFLKMNASNLVAAIIDSMIFPLVAFGAISPVLAITQASAKFIGGLFWGLLAVWFIFRSR